jgi:hypothetical protein
MDKALFSDLVDNAHHASRSRGARADGVDASRVCARVAGQREDATKLGARTSLAHGACCRAAQNRFCGA